MSGVVYLTTDQVVLINARFGCSVRELSTVDAATMRCAHSYDGTEFYPTLGEGSGSTLGSGDDTGFHRREQAHGLDGNGDLLSTQRRVPQNERGRRSGLCPRDLEQGHRA